MTAETPANDVLNVVECEITPLDSLYYASREAGETFMTEPYLMHTALYYAFGFFPTRFRVEKQGPVYVEHRDQSELGTEAYIHPAIVQSREAYQTRRFAAKGDSFRSESSRGSGNFKETGHQKMLTPDHSFLTFITTENGEIQQQVEESIPSYIRIGKKMTNARVRTATHSAPVEAGTFKLEHPISNLDYSEERYELLGDLRWKRMTPVDLIIEAKFDGRHATVDPAFADSEFRQSVTLPVDTTFLAQR